MSSFQVGSSRHHPFSLFPPELWTQIAINTSLLTFRSLALSHSTLYHLLSHPHVRKSWVLNRTLSPSDALVFAYVQKLDDVISVLLETRTFQFPDFRDAFTWVAYTQCEEGKDDTNEKRKVYVIKKLLEMGHRWDKEAAERVLKEGKCETEDEERKRATIVASGAIHHELVHELVEQYGGGGDSSTSTKTRQTRVRLKINLTAHELSVVALRWCAYYGEHLVVQFLLEDYGLNCNNITCMAQWWQKMFREQRYELIRLLLRNGANVSGVDGLKESLKLVALGGDKEGVKILLDEGKYAKDEKLKRDAILFAFQVSMRYGQTDVVRMLVEDYDCRPEGEYVYEPFRSACYYGHGETVAYLLANRIVDLRAYKDNHLALEEAVKRNHPLVVSILLEYGANPWGNSGKVLFEACKRGFTDVVRILWKWMHRGDDPGLEKCTDAQVAMVRSCVRYGRGEAVEVLYDTVDERKLSWVEKMRGRVRKFTGWISGRVNFWRRSDEWIF